MTDRHKTKAELLDKMTDLRQRMAELEKMDADNKRAEEKLRASEERFSAFMENIPAAVYIKDEDDRHIYGNRSALASVGKKPDEFIGSTTRDFFPIELATSLIEFDRKVLDENITRVTEEWKRTTKDDVEWRRDIKFPIDLESGKKLLGGIAIDITEIKQNEQRLQKAHDEIESLKEKLEQENIYLREEIKLQHRHHDIVGQSDPIKRVLSRAEQVAGTDSTVLIQGETGTGKELIARVIHNLSSRDGRAMVKVNCAALPSTLVESELFGREKGAYTGALSRQIGRFEIADGSTIFLDEIGDLPPDLQGKLLRVLEEGEFERLGSPKTITVNVRVIAATNRDLAELLRAGRFREDLYYRLSVFPIEVPPLRERTEDIPPLVWTFVQEFERMMGKRIETLPRKRMEALQQYPWPGNVRELRNVIEQAMILSQGRTLDVQVPGLWVSEEAQHLRLEDMERNHITAILERTGWRVSGKRGAAEILGLKPTTLESKMKKLGIKRPAKDPDIS